MDFLFIAPWLDFSPIKPTFGLLFWSTIIFLIFWLIIGKFAFKPIVKALNDRADDIQKSLDSAKNAKLEMSQLKAENETILAEAREEKMRIIKEAKDAANLLIAEGRDKAKEEAQRIVVNAKNDIEIAKKSALVDVKNQVGAMAIEIAEKVIRKNLASDQTQQEYVNRLMDEIKMN
ncbi:MAG: F0F1 ATP synthase subunit B [Saprospiraceae bacterium]|uniref:ATP synthase subunit b n=1 Tax=Candidatus Defluviibacterium haderslevense TaxID=2981993 RepID=A0A9D7S6H2_9BACT|nr:F0F1 ATP synthase subunit B [Candidatus Defluviibacterium haderslevense]MCC7025356.1 F0F1 ATP synthase subunit B [Saprospiraceae bacterium]MBK7243103.1 F0F1 ATP synthase subunit B [Candidatus Defluviibacterium haderslevense]MBK8243147.1 F0F1 ATP synthase subunit B [Candidatus Defluviibacterium haderslevense]MBK9716266.1 F0F1 ATP synthase subunit B [Candidatus Defluviibacterium haderslevense]